MYQNMKEEAKNQMSDETRENLEKLQKKNPNQMKKILDTIKKQDALDAKEEEANKNKKQPDEEN